MPFVVSEEEPKYEVGDFMKNFKRSIKKRMVLLFFLFCASLFLLIGRLFWIQIVKGEWYRQKAFEQHNSERILSPSRGTLYDRNGKILAISASAERISVNPIEVRRTAQNLEELSSVFSSILDMDRDKIREKLNKNNRYETLKRRVDKDVGDKIRQLRTEKNISGIYVDEDSRRFYPNRNLAAHVLGFIGDDNQGLFGIELVLEEELKGKEGKILSEVDVLGRPVPFKEERRVAPIPGNHVVLTLDETLQHFVEKELEKVIVDDKIINGASAIIMDPRNGDILAMASKPDFDPNQPRGVPIGRDPLLWKGTTAEDIKILEETVWRNKAVMDSYEPGSTFKAITTAVGLEEKAVDKMTPSNDRTINVAGHNINCWKPNAHGLQPFYKAVHTSCNPVFVEVARRIGISDFYHYMKHFGFYEKTGIILPGEATSIIHQKPTEIDMATASFGQRFQITPLQLVSAYSALVNGGNLIKPRLVKELRDANGSVLKTFASETSRVVISSKTSEEVRQILEGVVSEGTGRNAYVKGYRVAGKTGTSETLVEGRYIASFAGFAPADDPQLVVLVVLDNPQGGAYYGGTVAAPVAGRIFEQALNYLGVERVYTEEDRKNMAAEVYVPDVREKSVQEAKRILMDAGLSIKMGNPEELEGVVFDQTPKPGVFIARDSLIILYTKENAEDVLVEMPNVLGYSIQDATYILRKQGLNIRAYGLGNAFRQSHAPGSMIPKGSVVDMEFKSLDTH
jgi:stage V sporulation protein D (sporulation-specific penicillin-binding protein)